MQIFNSNTSSYICEYDFINPSDFQIITELEDIIDNQEKFSFLIIKDSDTKEILYKKDASSFNLYYKDFNKKIISIRFEVASLKNFSLNIKEIDDLMALYENKYLKDEKSIICIESIKNYGFREYIRNQFDPFKKGSMTYNLIDEILTEYPNALEVIFKENNLKVCFFNTTNLSVTISLEDFNNIRKEIIKEKEKNVRLINAELMKEAKTSLIVHGNLPSLNKNKKISFNIGNKKIINELTALKNSLSKLLSDKKTIETDLQKFFYENKLLINNVLGYPISFSIKEVELLIKNSQETNKIDLLTFSSKGQRIGIIEFKNDKKFLLSQAKKTYRNNLKGISSDVSTAVQQCSFYKTLLIQNILNTVDPKLVKVATGSVFHIDCIVIIGRDSCLKDDLSINSFNAYKNSCNIIIKTYDETLEQIEDLIKILNNISK